jgi:hypothetical protein
VEQAVFLPRISLVMVGKSHKLHGIGCGLYGGFYNGVPPISVIATIVTFQSRNADAPLRLLRHPKKGSFKSPQLRFREVGGAL